MSELIVSSQSCPLFLCGSGGAESVTRTRSSHPSFHILGLNFYEIMLGTLLILNAAKDKSLNFHMGSDPQAVVSFHQSQLLLQGLHMQTSIQGRICNAQHFWTRCADKQYLGHIVIWRGACGWMERSDVHCQWTVRSESQWPGACVSINFVMFHHEKHLCIAGTSFHAACLLSCCSPFQHACPLFICPFM